MYTKASLTNFIPFKLVCFAIIAGIISFFYFYVLQSPFFDQNQVEKSQTAHLSSQFDQNNQDGQQLKKNQFTNFLEHLKKESLSFIPLSENDKGLTLANVDVFNNIHLYPRLKYIVTLDYFRFVKLNLNRKCELWSDNLKCSLRDCRIEFCDESQLPPSIKHVQDDCSTSQELSKVNETVDIEHVKTLNSLFECYDVTDQEDGQYIDLLLNPERYTGYKGEEAHKIWRSIYEENCFLRPFRTRPPFTSENLCYEERVFYRAISGLHTSINVHLSALYIFMDGSFTYNKREFIKRFENRSDFLKNLYFLYFLEMKALLKSEPYLMSKVNWQSIGDGNATREAIKDLLKVAKTFKCHFNESFFYGAKSFVAKQLAQHFNNITTNIMNCVACDKCKLWGKVQTHGLGTAFKILLTENIETLYLHRHEIITLVNAFTRLSTSINFLEEFNKLLKQDVNKPSFVS